MAVSASFYRNVFLLNQLVPPTEDFKKYFREGMFDKPNIAGFIHVSHYLLTIFDAERFKKLVEWPVICKKMESKYRNDVKDYLNVLALENPDIGFPQIRVTHLHHAGGTKFTIIMWKLSQLAMKKYVISKSDHEIISVPKSGPTDDLVKTYLHQSKTNISCNVSILHEHCSQMEKAANSVIEEEKENLIKIKTELFDKKQSVAKIVATAPVATSIKQRLTNVEDLEVIQMWKNSLDQNICYIQKRHAILKDLEKICENIIGIISNLSNDTNVLDGKQLKKIDCSLISELPFPPNVQCCLYRLYNDDKLIYHNFISLLTAILYQIYQWLEKDEPADLSQCLLQLEASTEDMKSVCNMFKTFLTSINCTEEKNMPYEKNMTYTPGLNILPLVKNVLLMPSPLIRINTNCTDEKNDLHKLLQLTPGEVTHKSLFSRHIRKRNYASDIRTNLFISRINVDDAILLNNEKKDLGMQFATPMVSHSHRKLMGKYSRLFSTQPNKNMKAYCSMLSLPSTAQAHSSVITSAGEIPNLSDLNLDITAKSFFDSIEEFTPVQCTPTKRDVSQDAFRETDVYKYEYKVNKPKLDELTEVQLIDDGENKSTIIKHDTTPKRRSIGDLVERYRKLVEVSNNAVEKFQNACIQYENE